MAYVQWTDGTLFELALCPHSDDFSNYYSRKFGYSLDVLVINNDMKEILYHLAGFSPEALTIFMSGKIPLCVRNRRNTSL